MVANSEMRLYICEFIRITKREKIVDDQIRSSNFGFKNACSLNFSRNIILKSAFDEDLVDFTTTSRVEISSDYKRALLLNKADHSCHALALAVIYSSFRHPHSVSRADFEATAVFLQFNECDQSAFGFSQTVYVNGPGVSFDINFNSVEIE